jgi:gas vesicle protein
MLVKGSSAFVAGLLAFVTGAIFGVLFAPASGERTRRRLRRSGEHFADKASDVTDSAKGMLADARRRIA